MKKLNSIEIEKIVTAKAAQAYANTDPLSIWTDGEAYTIAGTNRPDKPTEIISEGLTAEEISQYLEALDED